MYNGITSEISGLPVSKDSNISVPRPNSWFFLRKWPRTDEEMGKDGREKRIKVPWLLVETRAYERIRIG